MADFPINKFVAEGSLHHGSFGLVGSFHCEGPGTPAVFAATEPAPTDLKKLRGKKIAAIVWHALTLGIPALWLLSASAVSGDKGAMLAFVFLGSLVTFSALVAGLAMSVASINNYLTFKAQLRWAFPDAQAWSAAPTSKTL